MIEYPQRPVVGGMAATALGAQRRLVDILSIMAILARLFRQMKFLTGMATPAGSYGMHAFQGKLCELMVEGHGFTPECVLMADRTVF